MAYGTVNSHGTPLIKRSGPGTNYPVVGSVPDGTTEPFPSCLCLADLQYVDCLGELPGTPGAAAELAQDPPGLQLGVRALAG